MKKGVFKILSDGDLVFWCKGCNRYHLVNIDESKSPHWEFNGDYDKPTFNPSILVTTQNKRCHSFIRDGKIQYLDDCYHELAGQIVDLKYED